MDSTEEPGDVTYDSVAIPEVHIRKKGTKPAKSVNNDITKTSHTGSYCPNHILLIMSVKQ